MEDVRIRPGLSDRVQSLVAAMLAAKGLAPVASNASLRSAGLASLDIVNLMMAVEDAFGLTLPEAEMTPDNFHCAATVEALVARLI